MRLIREFENNQDFSVFSGVEQMADAAMITGSDGIVPGIATLIPDVFVGIYNAAKAGNLVEAKKLQTRALAIMDAVYLDGFWAWVAGQKYALSALGLCQEYFTLDNRSLTDEEKAKVRKAITDFGIKA
jgi:4-hydroxy-tetrahydrodipicolinate synthase